jgi:hypothetical protein
VNLPGFLLALPLERATPPVTASVPPPPESGAAVSRPGAREQAFEQALEQQLGRRGAASAGRPGPAFSRVVHELPLTEVGILPNVASSCTWPDAEEQEERYALGSLLRLAQPGREERRDEPPPVDSGWQTAPVWLSLPPPVAPVFADSEGAVTVAELPRAVLGQVRWTVERHQPLTQLDFHLSPPALGPVHLQISYTEGVVGVQLTALTLQARQSLEAQAGQIQSILHAHNLTAGPVRVVAPAAGRSGTSGPGLRQEPGGLGTGQAGRRRQSGASDEAIRQA